jgi:hypothetical protein
LAVSALLGTGVAVASEYNGETYKDAADAISQDGGTPVVATRVGGQLSTDECIVVNSQDHSMSTSCRSPTKCGSI